MNNRHYTSIHNVFLHFFFSYLKLHFLLFPLDPSAPKDQVQAAPSPRPGPVYCLPAGRHPASHAGCIPPSRSGQVSAPSPQLGLDCLSLVAFFLTRQLSSQRLCIWSQYYDSSTHPSPCSKQITFLPLWALVRKHPRGPDSENAKGLGRISSAKSIVLKPTTVLKLSYCIIFDRLDHLLQSLAIRAWELGDGQI